MAKKILTPEEIEAKRVKPTQIEDDGIDIATRQEAGENCEEIDFSHCGSPSYLEKIRSFKERMEIDDSEAVPDFYLYKYDHPQLGEKRSFYAKYSDLEPPDEEFIGHEFGSGRYMLIMSIRHGKESFTRGYKFKLAPHWDQKKRNGSSVQHSQPIVLNSGGGNHLQDTLAVLRELITVMSPLFQRQTSPSVPDFGNLLMANYEQSAAMMRKALTDTQEIVHQARLNQVNDNDGDDVDTTVQEPSIVEKFLPLLADYLPILLGNGAESKALQTVVKQSPQLKKIVKNKSEYERLIEYIDKKQGTEQTNKLLKKLGLVRYDKK